MAGLYILLIAILASLSCSLLGVFLVLRKMSMQVDAISHTVLLGIVLVFMIVSNLNSPWLIVGATFMGVITVFLTELIVKSKKTDESSAVGVVFPLLFSIAVIIISMSFGGIHLDIDAVLLGKLEFAVFEQLHLFGRDLGPQMLYTLLFVFIINGVFVMIAYRGLKIASFDAALAATLGLMPVLIHYLLMTFVSLTAVTAFNAVGSILVIALMIGPAVTARLLTNKLKDMIILSMIIGVLNSILGYVLSIYTLQGEVTVAGMIATTTLIVFLLTLAFSPKKGVFIVIVRRYKQKQTFAFNTLIFHIGNHENNPHELHELSYDHMHEELKWHRRKFEAFIKRGEDKHLIVKRDQYIGLTKQGWSYLKTEENMLLTNT